jgi:membrane associated rhomboid family serine protease
MPNCVNFASGEQHGIGALLRWTPPQAMTFPDNFSFGSAPRREPIFNIPSVVVLIVAALLAIHGTIEWLDAARADSIIVEFGFIPGRVTLAFASDKLAQLLARANIDSQALQQAAIIRQYHLWQGGAKLWTMLTYAGLHGSWTHVGLNCVWLVAFGPPVARRIGAPRFLGLFCVTAIAGALSHYAVNPMDFSPLIGASAADSGLMAAAARFMFQPGAPLGSPGGYSSSAGALDYDPPAPGVRALLRDRRAVLFIVIWLATNLVFGAGAESFGLSEGPVAWVAHVGGFAAGFFLFPWFDGRVRRGND